MNCFKLRSPSARHVAPALDRARGRVDRRDRRRRRCRLAFRKNTRPARASTSTRSRCCDRCWRDSHPAEPRSAGSADEPDADQPAQCRETRPHGRPGSRAPRSNAAREELIDGLMKTMQLVGQRHDAISMSSPIATRIRSRRRTSSSRCSRSSSNRASATSGRTRGPRSSFSTSRSSATRKRLQAAENRLKEFKLKYMGVPGQGGGPGFFRPALEA